MVKFTIQTAIARCAAIEDELKSRGADVLIKERDGLKKQIKSWMIENKSSSYLDESSNWEAVLQERKADDWNIGKLKELLSPSQKKRYIIEWIDEEAIDNGMANGDLSRAKLENSGSITRVPISTALYVRERKE